MESEPEESFSDEKMQTSTASYMKNTATLPIIGRTLRKLLDNIKMEEYTSFKNTGHAKKETNSLIQKYMKKYIKDKKRKNTEKSPRTSRNYKFLMRNPRNSPVI